MSKKEFVCGVCKKKFLDVPSTNRKVCSWKCKCAWQKGRGGAKKQNIKIKCKECGSEIITCKSSIKNGRKFCSKLCADIHRIGNEEYKKGCKGKTWEQIHGKQKAKDMKKLLSIRSKSLHKLRKDVAGKGKTMEERFGKEKGGELKEILSSNVKAQWKDNRERLLKSKNRFKKGDKPWNKGLTKKDERVRRNIEVATRTKNNNYLKKLGVRSGN